MQRNIMVLTLGMVRNDLEEWYADMVVQDRRNVLEHIQDGRFGELVPDLDRYSPNDLAEQFAELNLGEHYGIRVGADQVVVEIDPEHYVVVWDSLNVEPERRHQISNLINSEQVVS